MRLFRSFSSVYPRERGAEKNRATTEGVELNSGWGLEPERGSLDALLPKPPFNYTHLLRPHSWQRAAAFTDTAAARFSRSLPDAPGTFAEIAGIKRNQSVTGLITNLFTQTRVRGIGSAGDETQTSRTQRNDSGQTQRYENTVPLTN